MRILDVAPRPLSPPNRGPAIRVHHLLTNLSRRHQVRHFSGARNHAWTLRPSVRTVELSPSFRLYAYSHPAERIINEIAYRSWISRPVLSGCALRVCRPSCLNELLSWADVVLVEFPWQFRYCRERLRSGKIVLASHNVESQSAAWTAAALGRGASDWWVRFVERVERAAVAGADLILAVSPEDRREFIPRYGADPARLVEIPNGADTDRMVPVARDMKPALRRSLGLPERPTILFPQSAYAPEGLPALEWIRKAAQRFPQATFLVVGSIFPAPRVEGNILATGPVADSHVWFQASDVSLCPVDCRCGTKIKLIESLAFGLPTVAFAESLYGTALEHGKHLLVAGKSVPELVSALHRLLDEPGLGERLAKEGRRFVVEHHDWKRIAQVLESALLQLVGSDVAREAV